MDTHEHRLITLSATTHDEVLATFLPALERALAGTGSAVAPLGVDPDPDGIRIALAPEQPLERPDIAVVVPTSGSSGEPKPVLLPAGALRASAAATHARLGGGGNWLLALPPARIAGLQVLVRSLLAGTVPEVLSGGFHADRFTRATARLRARAGRAYTALVPTQLHRLLDAGPAATEALASYDAILLGGGPAPESLLARARAAGVSVVTTYGMTETAGGCVYDGWPLPEVRVDLDSVDGGDGRIRIGGPVLFAGYRGLPDLTAEALVDGWHVTRDLGRFDSLGRLEILGRVDDVVVSGGVNVPLPAVERSLLALPDVAEAVVVGVPDPEWGARVVAYVVTRPGAEPPSLEGVRDQVAAEHPRAYAPKELHVLDELPLLPSGKPDRAALTG